MEGEGEIVEGGGEVLAVSDEGVQPVAEGVDDATPTEAPPAEAAAPDAPVEPAEEPLWTDEQWTGWDGTKDNLDGRYHQVYDRLTETHQSASDDYERRLKDSAATVEALLMGETDPQLDILRGQIAEFPAQLQAEKDRADAAEAALAAEQNDRSTSEQAKANVEITKFRDVHAWALAEGTPEKVQQAISALIDNSRGDKQVMPVAAGNLFKGKDAKYSEALADSILRGDSVATAQELAALRTAAPVKAKLPEQLPGEEMVNGTTTTKNTARRAKSSYEANSMRETRSQMAESMFAPR